VVEESNGSEDMDTEEMVQQMGSEADLKLDINPARMEDIDPTVS